MRPVRRFVLPTLLVLLAAVGTAAHADPPGRPDAEAIAAQCIQAIGARASQRSEANALMSANAATHITALVEAGQVQQAFALATHAKHVINHRSFHTVQVMQHRAQHCIAVLMHLGRPDLAAQVHQARVSGVQAVHASRMAAIETINSALPPPPQP
ncbi:MAG: hypothetical protein KF817_08555 [Phycisphaeraceae bacterium]|nr:hypothetical protein [Phycisphaeraceae bacterium]